MMIIAGCDDGTMNMPNWPENLRFASRLCKARWKPTTRRLTRPVYLLLPPLQP